MQDILEYLKFYKLYFKIKLKRFICNNPFISILIFDPYEMHMFIMEAICRAWTDFHNFPVDSKITVAKPNFMHRQNYTMTMRTRPHYSLLALDPCHTTVYEHGTSIKILLCNIFHMHDHSSRIIRFCCDTCCLKQNKY